MSGTISFNPYATNQPQDSFILRTQGYVQGAPYDDTVARLWLATGSLASTETLTMWGGVPITENIIVAGTGADGIGPSVARATTQANATGFSTFLQMNSMIIVPGNTVPLAGVRNAVGFFRLGTQQRLAVQVDPAVVAALTSTDGAINSQALYWDVTNYRITLVTTGGNWALPTSVRLLSVQTNSKIVSYNSTTGAATWVLGDAAMILI